MAHSIDDGRSFHYISREPFVSRGMGLRDAGSGMYNTSGSAWDSGFVFLATGAIPAAGAPGHTDMFYFGSQMTHHEAAYTTNMLTDVAKGYGRLRLRQEGFVSLAPHAFTQSGALAVQSHAITVSSECLHTAGQAPPPVRLRLNLDTGVAGHVNVTLLDVDTGRALPAFAGAHILPIVANHVRVPVQVRAPVSVGGNKGAVGFERPPSLNPLLSFFLAQFWSDASQSTLTDDLRPALSRNGSLAFAMNITAAHLYAIELSC